MIPLYDGEKGLYFSDPRKPDKNYLIIHTRIEEVDGSEASLAKLASSYAAQIQALAKES